jgi:hypothetical protein
MNTAAHDGIQWGALIVLPTGANDVEVALSRNSASLKVWDANRTVGRDVAQLVYRTVKYGQWLADQIGDQWGVQYTWAADGHVEVEPRSGRAAADAAVRCHRSGESTAQTVSRSVEYGDWWLAAMAEGTTP